MISGLEWPEARGKDLQELIRDVYESGIAVSDAAQNGSAHQQLARDFFRGLENLTLRAAMLSATQGSFQTIPQDIWLMIWSQFGHLAVGDIPGPIRACEGRGTKEPTPIERKDIMAAVAYIAAAKAGLLEEPDKAPVKRISELYHVEKRTVQNWCERFPVADPGLFCDGRFDTLRGMTEYAGARYSIRGRSQSAVRGRSSDAQGRKHKP